jgi:hypothetical protein
MELFAAPLILAGALLYNGSSYYQNLAPRQTIAYAHGADEGNTALAQDAPLFQLPSVTSIMNDGKPSVVLREGQDLSSGTMLNLPPAVDYEHIVSSNKLEYLIDNIEKESLVPTFDYNRGKYGLLEKSASKEDPMRELKDACTAVVTKVILDDQATLFNYLSLVVTTVNTALDRYKKKHHIKKEDIIFFYKGGNVLRLVSSTFFSKMPYKARAILENVYTPYFARSDSDFELFINGNIENFDKIHRDCLQLIYVCGVTVRNTMEETPDKYMGFFKLNRKKQQELISAPEVIDPFINAACYSDPTNTRVFGKTFTGLQFLSYLYVAPPSSPWQSMPSDSRVMFGRRDFIMQFVKEESTDDAQDQIGGASRRYSSKSSSKARRSKSKTTTSVASLLKSIPSSSSSNSVQEASRPSVIFPTSTGTHTLFCYINDTLLYHPEIRPDLDSHFALFRIKVHFNLFLDGEVITVPGELLDVSMPYENDFKHRRLSKIPYNRAFHTYKISSGASVLELESYSLHELGYDILQMLFFEELPWNIRKYEKRMHRCMFLILSDLIAIQGLSSERIHRMYSDIAEVLTDGIPSLSTHAQGLALSKKIHGHTLEGSMFALFCESMIDMYNMNSDIMAVSEVNSVKGFYQIILENIQVGITVCKEMAVACSSRVIGKSSVYSIDFKNIV